jgi:hypothetical protein
MTSQAYTNNNLTFPRLIVVVLVIAFSLFLYMIYSSTAILSLSIQSTLRKSLAGPLVSSSPSSSDNIKIDVISPKKIKGTAGQFIKVEGIITNLSHNKKGGIAYISIVDLKDKVPIDLEDWSAQKGLYIPSIESGQSFPLEWNVRLVKAGSYSIDILFDQIDNNNISSPSTASSKIILDVAPKLNLNPGNVLPVAFGVPVFLVAILGVVNYIRGRKTGIYG